MRQKISAIMEIYKIEPGSFKLDGGATFGVVPKKMWEKVYPADENNLCKFAIRNLLIVTNNRRILIDTGIGDKQDEKFLKHYHLEGHHSIVKSVEETGYKAEDITDIVITHMHFDHVGGAIRRTNDNKLVPTFPNATYHISKQQWDWADKPNTREKPSYIKENIQPLMAHKVINFIEKTTELVPGVKLELFNGHTAGLIVPYINFKGQTLVYTGDLLALSAQIPKSWVCGFDTRPLISIEERNTFFKEVFENNYIIVFQHDFYTEACNLEQTEKGYKPLKTFKLDELFI